MINFFKKFTFYNYHTKFMGMNKFFAILSNICIFLVFPIFIGIVSYFCIEYNISIWCIMCFIVSWIIIMMMASANHNKIYKDIYDQLL